MVAVAALMIAVHLLALGRLAVLYLGELGINGSGAWNIGIRREGV